MSDQNISMWLAERPEITSIFACVCDLNGIMCGKRIPVEQAGKMVNSELRMPLSVTNLDVWGEDIEVGQLVFETADTDGICDFTDRALSAIIWTKWPTALAMLWMRQEDGEPFYGDPRRVLAAIFDRYKAMGLTPVVATELEFYLCDPSQDRPQAPCSPVTGKRLDSDGALSLDELEHFDVFLSDVYTACQEQGIPADAAISENGAGQFEINMMHVDDPLRAADDAILFKRLVRGIARKHGFAAPPITGDAYSLPLPHLPMDWATAVDTFRKGKYVQNVFSKRLQTMLVECKTQELKKFARQVSDFEYHSYFEVV